MSDKDPILERTTNQFWDKYALEGINGCQKLLHGLGAEALVANVMAEAAAKIKKEAAQFAGGLLVNEVVEITGFLDELQTEAESIESARSMAQSLLDCRKEDHEKRMWQLFERGIDPVSFIKQFES